MKTVFPEAIEKLPLAEIPLDGLTAFLSQGPNHQILFMSFDEDVELTEHSHAAQYGIILEGRIDLCIDGEMKSYYKGDRYYIPAGVRHYGKIYAGYADVTFFDEKDRYHQKTSEHSEM
jgi:quercetin dioxygenase-like cupin family protein